MVRELANQWRKSGQLLQPLDEARVNQIAAELSDEYGRWLAAGPSQEDVNQVVEVVAKTMDRQKLVKLNPDLLATPRNEFQNAWAAVREQLGLAEQTLFTQMLSTIQTRRTQAWAEHSRRLNYELFDQAVGAFDWSCIEELRKGVAAQQEMQQATTAKIATPTPAAVAGAAHAEQQPVPLGAAAGLEIDPELRTRLQTLRTDLDKPFASRLLLWQKTKAELVDEMDRTIQVPGWGNIFTQPIINRIQMLATGVRTMIGVKVFGDDLDKIQQVSQRVAEVLRKMPGAVGVTPDQIVGKGYLEITIDRQKAARYGINVGDVQDVIEVALGGKPITSTVEGRERFPVRIRYARDFRSDEAQVKNLLINATGAGAMEDTASDVGGAGHRDGASSSTAPLSRARPLQIPLASVADVRIVEGPSQIKSENGMLRSYVQLNVSNPDVLGFVDLAKRRVAQEVTLPPGMHLEWSGEFENKLATDRTMRFVIPAVLVLIFVILYLTYQDFADAVLMMMAVPEALVGGVFFLWLTGHSYSVAVQVGFIACFGMATETGIIMLVYLREAIERRGGLEKIQSLDELREAIIEGAVHRLRPKLLTEGVAIVALAPMLWASGVGHEVLSAMAEPVLGGLLVSDEVVDLFLPVRFYWVRRHRWLKMRGLAESMNPKPLGEHPSSSRVTEPV